MPCVAHPTAPAPKPTGVDRTEPLAPLPNSLVGDGDAPLSQQIFHIPEAEPEAVIQPDGVTDDLRRKPITVIAGPLAGSSEVLEVPVTIVYTSRMMRRSRRLRRWFRSHRRSWTARAADRFFRLAPQWFRPYPEMSAARLIAVYETASAAGVPAVEMMLHSSELMPGGSPYNRTPAAVADLYSIGSSGRSPHLAFTWRRGDDADRLRPLARGRPPRGCRRRRTIHRPRVAVRGGSPASHRGRLGAPLARRDASTWLSVALSSSKGDECACREYSNEK